ncbi:OmpA family protein [Nocardiopsis dassonvillei]|uniref:OmpA family protein n=1 Tax=Nocardiopsis dassonvillei TaxID=2014 RepID=UPI003672F590
MRRHPVFRKPTRVGALLLGTALLATACAPGGGETGEEPSAAPSSTAVDYPDGPFEREGALGTNRMSGTDTVVRVDEVVNHSDRTVVRFTAFPGGEDGDMHHTSAAFGAGQVGSHKYAPVGLRMIDPVGQRLYYPALNGDDFVGSEISPYVVAGASYRMEAHFPPLPADTRRVSVSFPGTQGLMTGLPVDTAESAWNPDEAPTEEVPSYWSVRPGDEIVMPVADGPVPEQGHDLYSIVESAERVRETSTTEQRVDLDADVLFAFDEAELTQEATAVLDEVAAETREKADPELPPITVVGHTDGVGGDDYNQTLSQERAEAVRDYLEAELGTDYEYVAEGRGSTEPVAEEGAEDDEEARARNRRVEVSYNILRVEQESQTGEEETVSALVGTGNTAAPAFFVAEEREPVATATGTNSQGFDYTLDVFSLRRDGAFIVAAVALTNDSGRSINGVTGAHFWEQGAHGGRFSSFGIVEPGSGDVYRSVRIGEPEEDGEAHFVEPVRFPYRIESGQTNQFHLYFPAPPLGVDTVNMEAGAFGTLEDLPLG